MAITLVCALAVGCTTIEGTRSGVVRVQAEGTTEAVPDVAVLDMSVQVTGASVAAARDQAARSTQAVIDELMRRAVEDRDIRTSRFTIQPQYEYVNDGARRLRGYRVVHGLTVTIRNPDTLGATADAVSAAAGDALAFDHVAFTHSDPERLREEARRDAVRALHRTARQLVAASNRELGPLLEISEDAAAPDRGPYPELALSAMPRSAAADTPISAGSDVIRVTVRGTFALR